LPAPPPPPLRRRRALAVDPAPGPPQRLGPGDDAPAPGPTGRAGPHPPSPAPPHLRPRLARGRRQRGRPHAPGWLAGPGHALPLRRQRRGRAGQRRPSRATSGGPLRPLDDARPCGGYCATASPGGPDLASPDGRFRPQGSALMVATAVPTTVPVPPGPSALYKAPTVAGFDDVPFLVKEDLFRQVKADMRFPDYLYGCYECGICVAVCPSARFYDFSPRRIAQAAGREDVELLYQQMQEDIWECSQCFSCLRCPRGNNPGGIILIMREVAINNGLASAREALEGYSRIIFKIMSTGTQVSPDMLQPDAFPDWGPEVKDVSDNLELWRRALPPET